MLPGGRGEELIIIAAIALIVVGPKDLPKLLRQIGRFVGKMRAMADEFKASFEDMARQSELDELRKEVDALRANKIPILDDIRNDMRSIQSGIQDGFKLPGNTSVDIPPDPNIDAQMQGLPPAGEIPPVAPSAPQPVPEATVKPAKPSRARKAQAESEPVVPEPTVIVKRAPKRKVPS
jgi:sec-independent protein translocase protein TatB